jgi:hypothetical protein
MKDEDLIGKLVDFYREANELLAKLGAEGYVAASAAKDLMAVLFEIDGGVYDEKVFQGLIEGGMKP